MIKPLYEPPLAERSTIDQRHLLEQQGNPAYQPSSAPVTTNYSRPSDSLGETAQNVGVVALMGAAYAAEYALDYGLGSMVSVDVSASTVIAMATYDKESNEITLKLHSGKVYSYPCSTALWGEYIQASSKGSFANEQFFNR